MTDDSTLEKVELEKFTLEENPVFDLDRAFPEGKKAALRQYYAAFAAHFGAWIQATAWIFCSTALPSLRESKESFGELTSSEEAWIASIPYVGAAIGSLITGQIAQIFGPRKSLIISAFPLLGSWILITFAPNLVMILIGRFITGFFVVGVGVSTTLVAEYSHKDRRGKLNLIFDMMFCVGTLYVYINGIFTHWRVQAGLCGLSSFIFMVLLFTIPESPNHLMRNDKLAETKKALKKLRDKEDVDDEINHIKRIIKDEADKRSQNPNNNGGIRAHLNVFFRLSTLKPIIISIFLMFFLQMCGIVPITNYAVDVFKTAGTAQIHENVSTIVLGTINLVATCVGLLFVDKYGRRKLFIASELALTATLVAIGIFLYFKDGLGYANLDSYSWFLLVCFVLYVIAYSFGVGPLPWVIMGEILDPEFKGVSTGVIAFCTRVFGFSIMFLFKDMIVVFGQHGVYWYFAIVCLAASALIYFFLPETKGKNLQRIQEDLSNGWFHHKH